MEVAYVRIAAKHTWRKSNAKLRIDALNVVGFRWLLFCNSFFELSQVLSVDHVRISLSPKLRSERICLCF